MRYTALILCVLAVGLGGCGHVNTSYSGGNPFKSQLGVQFEPHSTAAATASRSSDVAVRFYPGDVPLLKAQSAEYLGDLELDVRRFIPIGGTVDLDTLLARAEKEAAARGGTHFTLIDKGTDVREEMIRPERVETQQVQSVDKSGQVHTTRVSTVKPAETYRTETPRAKFAVYRIAPESWAALPESLRPKAIAIESTPNSAIATIPVPASTTSLTQATVPAADFATEMGRAEMYADLAMVGVSNRDCEMIARGTQEMTAPLTRAGAFARTQEERSRLLQLEQRRGSYRASLKDCAAKSSR